MRILKPMSIMDFINGAFEACGSIAIFAHCRQLLKDKQVKGVSWAAVLFFTLWGAWNCVFYPSLHQWLSFTGGLAIVTANTWYLILLLKYRKN